MTDVVDMPSIEPAKNDPIPSESSPVTLKTEADVALPSESNWCPIPRVASQSLNRKFEVDLPNIEVTCLDMTAHGCFVLAGCSNGMVLLFDLTSSSKHGTLVGHIRAKGMHTNLILTVKVTEDCRYAFAGCLKGSMEMLAVDMGQIPLWRQDSSSSQHPHTSGNMKKRDNTKGLRPSSHAPSRVRTFNHLDPKLRGFGAVSRLRPLRDGVSDEKEKYVLICGKGIKSVHVWLFTPSTPADSTPTPLQRRLENDASKAPKVDSPGGPEWMFLFDVATNGVTIEALGFRFWNVPPPSLDSKVLLDGDAVESEEINTVVSAEPMLQMLSKSRGMCVRVWNLVDLERDMSEENECDLGKLPYEDIPSSQDTRIFSDDGVLAFGGLYNFSVLRLDAPKWANRESYEVPARCTEDNSGQRRRRLMREINEVISCHNGSHVLALCTDGGVLYYHSDSHRSCESGGFGSLTEFQSLKREVEVGPDYMTDDSWAIKRVGKSGAVVVIRAFKGLESKEVEGGGAIVDISLLADLAPESVLGMPSTVEEEEDVFHRNGGVCYHDSSQSRDIDLVRVSPVSSVGEENSGEAPISGKPPIGRPRKNKEKEKDKESTGVIGAGVSKVHSTTPREKKAKVSATSAGKYSTPSVTVRGVHKQSSGSSGGKRAASVAHISPQDSMQPLGGGVEEPRACTVSKRLYPTTPPGKKSNSDDGSSEENRDGDNSVSSVLTKPKERKSGRKRHLSLTVKYGDEPDIEESEMQHSSVRTKDSRLSSAVGSSVAAFSGMFKTAPMAELPSVIPHPGPPPTIKRVQVAPYPPPPLPLTVHENPLLSSATTTASSAVYDDNRLHPLLKQFQECKNVSWTPLTTSSFVPGIHLCDSTFLTRLGMNSRQTAECLLLEQDRLYQLFLIELLRGLEQILTQQTSMSAVAVAGAGATPATIIGECKDFSNRHFHRYQNLVVDMMKSQMIQMTSATRKDHLLAPTEERNSGHVSLSPSLPSLSSSLGEDGMQKGTFSGVEGRSRSKQWTFVHCRMYTIAAGIVESVEKMVKAM